MPSEDFLFILHQFIVSALCLFCFYFAWRDQAAKTYDGLKRVPLTYMAPLLIGMCIGLNCLFIYEWGSKALILSSAYAILVTLTIFDPKYGVSFFTFLLISRPWEFFNDQLMSAMPRDIFVLCFLSFIAHKIFRKRFYFQWNIASALVFFFATWTFFSFIPAAHSARAMEEYGEIFIKGIVVYFLIVNVVDKKEYILPIQSALVLGIGEKAIMSMYKAFFLKELADGDRLTSVGILENSNDIAAIMILAIPFTMVFIAGITNKIIRYLLAAAIFTFYTYLIWQSKSRGAILGIGTLIVAWYWLKAQNKKMATAIVVIGACMSFLAMSAIKRNAEDVEGSTSNRIIYWKAGLNMAVRNPIFGVGYGGYSLRLSEFANGLVGTEGAHKTVHSTWLLALAETGFMGFIFYIGIWIFSLRSAWAMRVEHPEFLLAILSYGTAITFLSHTYMLYPYILLGLTVASGQFYLKDEESAPTKGLAAAIFLPGKIT